MISFCIRLSPFLLTGTLFIFQQSTNPACAQTALKYSPAPVMNPLKGLVPYVRPASDRFPHRIFRASCSTKETMSSAHLCGMFRPKTMQHLKNSSMLRSLTANPNNPLFGHTYLTSDDSINCFGQINDSSTKGICTSMYFHLQYHCDRKPPRHYFL